MSNNSTESIVRDSLPHIEEPSSWEFGRILTVILCFIVGVCGHSSLCGLIVFFRESHSNFNQKRRLRVGETATRSCILAICFANFLHLLAKVLHVLDILFVDIWVFGQTFCKIFQFCSEIYILSGFLVAFLVLDRFISTNCCPRLPIFGRLRSNKFSLPILLGMLLLATVLALPSLLLSKTIQSSIPISDSGTGAVRNKRLIYCIDESKISAFPYLDILKFLLSYLLPTSFTLTFGLLLAKSHLQGSSHMSSSAFIVQQNRNILVSVVSLSCFFSLCFAFHWVSLYLNDPVPEGFETLAEMMPLFYCTFAWVPLMFLDWHIHAIDPGLRRHQNSLRIVSTTSNEPVKPLLQRESSVEIRNRSHTVPPSFAVDSKVLFLRVNNC